MELLPLGCFISLLIIHTVTSLDVSTSNERFSSVRHLPTEKSVNTLTSRTYRPLFYWDGIIQTTTLPTENTTKYQKIYKTDDKKKMKRRRRNRRRQKKRIMFSDDDIDRKKKRYKNHLGKLRVNKKKKLKTVEQNNELSVFENQLEVMLNNFDNQYYWKNECDCEHFCDKLTDQCGCYKGFYLSQDRKTCRDIDECLVDNGGCDHNCHNIIGRRTCSCRRGWRLHNNTRCLDINECSLNNGHGSCSHKCVNTLGSYRCSCENLPGTQLGPDGKRCVISNHLFENCRNLGGCSHSCIIARAGTSVYCTCPEGWQLGNDWKTCQEPSPPAQLILPPINSSTTPFPDLSDSIIPDHIVCPPLFPPMHGFIECFRDKSAPRPTAPSGRKRILNRPGSVCQLYCPVGYRKDGKWKQICSVDGKWEGDDEGKCIHVLPRNFNPQNNFIDISWEYTPPTVKCPGPIVVRLKPGQKAVKVVVPSPTSDLESKYIRSEPRSIDNTLTLPRGQHWVHFTATHPITGKSAECTTHVVIKSPPSP